MFFLRSKIAQTILGYFFLHETEELYLNEMVKKFGFDKRNAFKVIKKLLMEGVFTSEKKGKETYYSLNKKYPLFGEMKKIVLKTYGIESQLKSLLKKIPGIKEAYIIGSYAKDKMDVVSDIDVLVIGDVDTIKLNKEIAKLQKDINRQINLINITAKELRKKITSKDPFLQNVFQNKKIRLI
ncbi:MAG: nucleotidyltransferase domain-containing protein [Candidatus Omnitrophica bacterium]|nr:nucleotidyltransferase domain-containing protein [Candidatus Omnitrophota bacterium]